MDPELRRVIEIFIEAVRWAVACLTSSGLALPASNRAWSETRMPQVGTLADGTTYHKHGYGLELRSDARVVDFNFGERGETDGFDAWRLMKSADENALSGSLVTEADFARALEQARASGRVVQRGSLFFLNDGGIN